MTSSRRTPDPDDVLAEQTAGALVIQDDDVTAALVAYLRDGGHVGVRLNADGRIEVAIAGLVVLVTDAASLAVSEPVN